MFVCCECLSGRGFCDGLITCPEESYRLWYVTVCSSSSSSNSSRRRRRRGGLFNIFIMVFHKFLEPDTRFTLETDSDVDESHTAPN
jgi:hypothetical protein